MKDVVTDIVQNVEISSDEGVINIRPKPGYGPLAPAKLEAFKRRVLAVSGVRSARFLLAQPNESSYSNPWFKI